MMRVRILFAALMAGGIACSMVTSPAVPAESTAAVAIQALGGKCLDLTGNSQANGTPVVMWDCNGNPSQKWLITSDGQIKGLGDKCLDVTASSLADGTRVIIWPCTGNPNQKWSSVNGDIKGLGDKCLDVTGSNRANGTAVIVWPCHGGENQLWFFGDYANPSVPGTPGALGRIEFKPDDWKRNDTTYWKDTDGVKPDVAGCHVGVTSNAANAPPSGRFFGEGCRNDTILIESNPGVDVVHAHSNDLGHPDAFDCRVWCIGAKAARGGVCRRVDVNAPPPCTVSARCVCQ